MIITVSGKAGSGKSTIAKELAKRLEYRHFSMGDLQREIANEMNMTIEELAEFERTDPKYDRMIDDKQIELSKKYSDFVIDGWLCANFIPSAFKIFLEVDIEESVRRRLNHHRTEETFDNPEQVKQSLLNRQRLNQKRWIDFYDYDFLDMNNYDMVIDTTDLSIKEILDSILEKISKK